MPADESPVADYERVIVDSCRRDTDGAMVVGYAGRVFGGIIADLLPDEVVEAIQPGVELFFRYRGHAPGEPRQVVHVLMRHPRGGWAELYADWE